MRPTMIRQARIMPSGTARAAPPASAVGTARWADTTIGAGTATIKTNQIPIAPAKTTTIPSDPRARAGGLRAGLTAAREVHRGLVGLVVDRTAIAMNAAGRITPGRIMAGRISAGRVNIPGARGAKPPRAAAIATGTMGMDMTSSPAFIGTAIMVAASTGSVIVENVIKEKVITATMDTVGIAATADMVTTVITAIGATDMDIMATGTAVDIMVTTATVVIAATADTVMAIGAVDMDIMAMATAVDIMVTTATVVIAATADMATAIMAIGAVDMGIMATGIAVGIMATATAVGIMVTTVTVVIAATADMVMAIGAVDMDITATTDTVGIARRVDMATATTAIGAADMGITATTVTPSMAITATAIGGNFQKTEATTAGVRIRGATPSRVAVPGAAVHRDLQAEDREAILATVVRHRGCISPVSEAIKAAPMIDPSAIDGMPTIGMTANRNRRTAFRRWRASSMPCSTKWKVCGVRFAVK